MKILTRTLQLTCSLLALSSLSSGKVLAELSPIRQFSQENTHQLVAQNTSSSENTELTINPPLSQDQQNKVQAIDAKYIPQLEAAVQNYEQSVKDIETLIGVNPPNSEIIAKRKKVLDNELTVRNLAFDRLMAIREVLTPQQKESLATSVRQLFDKASN